MSTSLSHSGLQPEWKEEVNRRIEAHKHRKGISVIDETAPVEQQAATASRAATAAARVAARYAKTPSYSEMQAAEARAALRAAEATTRAALEAQAAAQAVLDHIETNSGATQVLAPESVGRPKETTPERPVQHPATTLQAGSAATRGVEIRWEPDMPVRPAQHEMRAEIRDPWAAQADVQEAVETGPVYDSVEAAQPIPANLIEFPREIIAPRRMRPRITEANPDLSDPQQLSIFEVEPDSISTEPMATASATGAEPTWIGSSWQEIKLDEQPQPLPDYYAIPPADAPKLYQAPFGRRMMATMVDCSLILGIVCGVAYLIASNFDHLPGKHVSEICGAVAVLGFAAFYEWFFFTFAKVTPGMRYAQLSLCTFDGEMPTSAQIKERMKAMLISVLPVGLGMLWSIFDEDQMSWHDRLSKTYLRLS